MHKQCPACSAAYPLDQQVCTQCGHRFRTQFTPQDQTQAFGASPVQPQPVYQQPVVLPPPTHIAPQLRKPTFMKEDDWKWTAGFAWLGLLSFGSIGVYLLAECMAIRWWGGKSSEGMLMAFTEYVTGRRMIFGIVTLVLTAPLVWFIRHIYVNLAPVPRNPTKPLIGAGLFCLLWALPPLSRFAEVQKQTSRAEGFFGAPVNESLMKPTKLERYFERDQDYFGSNPKEVEKTHDGWDASGFAQPGDYAIKAYRAVSLRDTYEVVETRLGKPLAINPGEGAAAFALPDGWVAVRFLDNQANRIICTGPIERAKAYPPIQAEYAQEHGGIIGEPYAGATALVKEVLAKD